MQMGQMAFDGGCDSGRVPLIASAANPNGLRPNQTAWQNSCTNRDGGLQPRPGLEYLTTLPIVGLYQVGYMYEPSGEFPYIVTQIGGRTFKTLVDVTPEVTTEITIPGDPNPATIDQGWMVQGEEFLIIQDGVSLPLIWDGNVMRRSLGPSRVVGVVNVLFAVPAVGSTVLVTLSAPFEGQNGDLIYINGKTYSATAAGNFITLRNDANGSIGATQPAGTGIFEPGFGGALITTTTAPFVIPPVGGSVQVAVDPAFGIAVPHVVGVSNNTGNWTVTAVGAAPAGANQVYLTNLTDTPGTNVAAGSNLETPAELPPAQAMDYYMGRIWLANGRQYVAGDIVGGPSGSAAYGYRDSVLKMTENAYTVSGGAFTVPTMAGNIRALKHPANIDTALGEGQLLPMTRRNIYSTNITPTRADWVLLSEPIQRVAQINFGTMSDRSVVQVNGDLYYRSPDGVRSFKQAIRFFNENPGNVPISHEMQRVFPLDDKSLLRFCSGIEFDNRLLMSALPYQTPAGVAHKCIASLNFDLLNSINQKLPPAWEGVWEGLNVLQALKGDFGGRQRAFYIVWSDLNQAIEIWEQTADALTDFGTQTTPGGDRITWSFETPAFDWSNNRDGGPFELKTLETMEWWIDRLSGTVDFYLEYRPSSYPCWIFWNRWTECAARNECELPNPLLPCNHPEQAYLPQYRAMMTMPTPPVLCNDNVQRPTNVDYSFQFRLTIKGSCRIRGLMAYGIPTQRAPFDGLRCPS